MRLYTRGLDEQYIYPCSKFEVKAAFGEGILGSVCFGLTPKFRFDPRHSPKPKILGRVIMGLSVHANPVAIQILERSSLYVYRVLKEEFSERTHAAVADLMSGPMRSWLDSQLSRSETQVFGSDKLLVELLDGRLITHETRFR